MVRLLPAFALAALCALAALPAAQAQAGANDPKITVTLEVTPASPTVALGGAQVFNVNVKLTTQNVYCNNQGTVTVSLSLKDTSGSVPGIAGTLPTSIDVPIMANINPPAVTSDSRGNSTARLEATVASSTAPDHDHSFTITANTPASLPTGCQALSTVPPPAATATADAKLRTGPITGGVPTGTATSTGGTGTTAQESFFLPLQVQVAALLAVGLVLRRRSLEFQ